MEERVRGWEERALKFIIFASLASGLWHTIAMNN